MMGQPRHAPGGRSASFGLAAFVALALSVASPASGARWFGLVDTGELFVSADQGVTWGIHAALPVRDAVALAAGTSTGDLYLASRTGALYHSTEDGANWAEIGAIPAGDIIDLLVHHDLSILLLTETGSLYRSTDQGATFTGLASVAASDCVSLTRVEPTGLAYILTRRGIVYESADGGETWTVAGAFATSDAVRLRALGSSLYAVTHAGAIHRSQDSGASWTAIGTLDQLGTSALAVDDGTLIVGTESGEVATSTTGESWTWRGSVNQLRMRALATDIPAAAGIQETGIRAGFHLGLPWPNPARTTGGLAFTVDLTTADELALELLDVNGRVRATRPLAPHPAGRQIITWQPAETPAGVYMVRVRTPSGVVAAARWVRVR